MNRTIPLNFHENQIKKEIGNSVARAKTLFDHYTTIILPSTIWPFPPPSLVAVAGIPCSSGAGGVGSIPVNSAQNVLLPAVGDLK
jgi:hypothetical protein